MTESRTLLKYGFFVQSQKCTLKALKTSGLEFSKLKKTTKDKKMTKAINKKKNEVEKMGEMYKTVVADINTTAPSYGHVMIDIETMGNTPNSAIIAIAAVEFDLSTGNTGKEFSCGVSLASCLDIGLEVSASTIIWWMQQGEEARRNITDGKKLPITDALEALSSFLATDDYCVWANSPSFDLVILSNAYRMIGQPIAWDFRRERCVRTLAAFNPSKKKEWEYTGVAHDALSDCKNQIGYTTAIIQSLSITQ